MKKNVVYQIRIDSRRATRRIRRAAAAAKRLKVALEAIQNTEINYSINKK